MTSQAVRSRVSGFMESFQIELQAIDRHSAEYIPPRGISRGHYVAIWIIRSSTERVYAARASSETDIKQIARSVGRDIGGLSVSRPRIYAVPNSVESISEGGIRLVRLQPGENSLLKKLRPHLSFEDDSDRFEAHRISEV